MLNYFLWYWKSIDKLMFEPEFTSLKQIERIWAPESESERW